MGGLAGLARAIETGEPVEVYPGKDFTSCWVEAEVVDGTVEYEEKYMPPSFYIMEDGWPSFANVCRTLGAALGGECVTYQDRKVDDKNVVISTRFFIHFKIKERIPMGKKSKQ